jgi:hypothetical protein
MFFKKGLGFFKKGKAFFYFFPDQIHLFKSHKDRDLIASCKKNLFNQCNLLINNNFSSYLSPRISCIFLLTTDNTDDTVFIFSTYHAYIMYFFNNQLITQIKLFYFD